MTEDDVCKIIEQKDAEIDRLKITSELFGALQEDYDKAVAEIERLKESARIDLDHIGLDTAQLVEKDAEIERLKRSNEVLQTSLNRSNCPMEAKLIHSAREATK